MFSVGSIGAIGRGSARSLDNLWRLAGFTPSFDFPFARNRSLVDAVSGQPLIAYTQASSGTYVNSDRVITTAASNEPRFDHDPSTGESLGLLPEQQMTNLLLRSEEIGFNPTWLATGGTVTGNTQVAPNGTTTASTLTTAAGTPVLYQDTVCAASTAYTFSFYVRLGTMLASEFRFAVRDNTNGIFIAAEIIPNVIPVPTEWRRVVYPFTTPVGCVNVRPYLYRKNETAASSVHLCCAQLEAGSSPTSYTPTGASTVTRSASLADLASSAIANNIRSFYCEFRSPAVGISGIVSLNDNTANNRASVITSGTDPRLVVHSGGVEQANVNGGTVTAGARTRVAVRINDNDFAMSINGSAVVTDTSGTLPMVDRIMIGRTQAGEFLNNRIARFTGWNQLLGDATLRSLSSQ